MPKIKKLIIFLSIIVVIIIIALAIMTSRNAKYKDLPDEIDLTPIDTPEVPDTLLKVVDEKSEYYAIKNCVDKYYLYYATIFNPQEYYMTNNIEMIEDSIKQSTSVLYNMLDEEYTQAKELTIENLKNKLKEIEVSTINVSDIYVSEKTENFNIYLVQGMIKSEKTNNINNFKVIVKVNTVNNTFSIIPQEYVEEKYNNFELGKEIDIVIPETIEKNNNNIISYKDVSEETYIKDLFSKFKIEIRQFPEQAYNNIETNYKNKCFDTLEEFQEYIKIHKKQYDTMQIDSYKKIVEDDNIQYICMDKDENYYIFKETSPFKYSVILGTYVIPTEEFIEEYSGKNEEQKVVLNIKRFFMGIDDKNYGYSYNVLSTAFKNNKYPTKSQFINYAKQNFFEENEIEYVSAEKENGVYIYKIKISDATGVNSEEKTYNMIVKLNSGTDFEMSFGME